APVAGMRRKSLLALPQLYWVSCIYELGLIGRAEIVWSKLNPTPESTKDRVHRTHEHLFHLTKEPDYYSAADELREPSRSAATDKRSNPARHATFIGKSYHDHVDDAVRGNRAGDHVAFNPLGKLPGSFWPVEDGGEGEVWELASQPLVPPSWLDVEHYAAF